MDYAREYERARRQALAAEEELAQVRAKLDRVTRELARARRAAEPDRVPDEVDAAAALEAAWEAEAASPMWPSRRALAAALVAFLRHPATGGPATWREETARRLEAAAARLPWAGEGA